MNVDHFYWIDVADAIQSSSSSISSARSLVSSVVGKMLPFFAHEDDIPVNARKKDSLPRDLASDYNALQKLDKLDLGAFSPIVNVAPSVIPVGYPAVRVFTYNVSGLNEGRQESKSSGKGVHRLLDDDQDDDLRDDEFGEDVQRYEMPVFTPAFSNPRFLQSTCEGLPIEEELF